MSEQLEIWAAYNDTEGYVDRPASRERAIKEAQNGTASERQQAILSLLDDAGLDGMTWKELGDELGLHHGKISGALSNMHLGGVVFMLRQTKDRCHPYVHANYRDDWTPAERYDEPARTRASKERELHAALLQACCDATAFGWSPSIHKDIESIVSMINHYERDNQPAERKE
jgi:hypothetical protein